MRRAALVSLAILLSAPVVAAELHGLTLPATVQVGAQPLVLNGIGLRSKLMFKVYVAGLYLESVQRDSAKILGSEGTRRIEMHMLRSLDGEVLARSIQDGFELNSGPSMGVLQPRLDRLKALMPSVKSGDVVSLTWEPGKGTTVQGGSRVLGLIDGKDFADALFACWLGREPVQDDLKTALVGG